MTHDRYAIIAIYYGDGSILDVTPDTWESAPDEDVQVVIGYLHTRDGRGFYRREFLAVANYYWLSEDGIIRSSDVLPSDISHMKKGRWFDGVRDPLYQRWLKLHREAYGDMRR